MNFGFEIFRHGWVTWKYGKWR